jgi:hypothetical protein
MCIINKGKIMLDLSWKKNKYYLNPNKSWDVADVKEIKFISLIPMLPWEEKKKIAGIIKGLFIALNVAQ